MCISATRVKSMCGCHEHCLEMNNAKIDREKEVAEEKNENDQGLDEID